MTTDDYLEHGGEEMSKAGLKPCPFCGEKEGGANNLRIADLGGWEVLCNCGVMFEPDSTVEGRIFATRAETITAWNTRKEPTP